MAALFRIKICGVTTVADALLAARCGADAVGLNFFPKSPRCVSVAQAGEIVQALPPFVCKVGVFVNASAEDTLDTAERVRLDVLQLHGDETPEHVARLGQWPVVRAFRLDHRGVAPVLAYLEQCRIVGRIPQAVLVEAYRAGAYGGTGQVADWHVVRQLAAQLVDLPLVLAGGLTPANVVEAIQTVAPMAVDTASGVESHPGGKDPQLVLEFVRRAQAAFAQEAAR